MRRNIKMMDKPLFFLTLLLSLFGLIMIFSSSYVKASIEEGNALKYLFKQGLIILIGFIGYIFMIFYPSSKYKNKIRPVLYIFMGLLLYVLLTGEKINGATSWIDLGYFNLQPSEFIKSIFIVFMAVYYSSNKFNVDNYVYMLRPFLEGIIIILLIFLQKDLGTDIIMFIIMFFTFFSIPIKKEYKKKIYRLLLLLGSTVVLGLIIAHFAKWSILTDSQKQRLNFFTPCERYEEAGSGYQVCNGYIAINSSNILGKGIGNSTQKYLYLPEAHTDYIFPIIIEELGLIVGVIIIILYAYLLYRILLITKASNNLMSGIIGYGITIYIFSHIFINLGGVLGLIPITGVPLPFLSYGGSFTINLLISIGLVQRIAIENNINKKEEAIINKIREQ
jgi:cell division protein FtsW